MTIGFQIIGHRGAAGHLPENTLASVQRGFALGADGVEIDVRVVDGRLVVLHDATLDRTTDGTGPADALSFDQLRALDAGGGERVPTLEEVFAEVAGSGFVNVELKGEGTAGRVQKLVRGWVERGDLGEDQVLVSSFDYRMLKEVNSGVGTGFRPRIGCLFERGGWETCAATARKLNAFSVNPPVGEVTAELVGEAHRSGWKVFVYTVNSVEEGRRLKGLGVDGVFTDFPDRMVELRD